MEEVTHYHYEVVEPLGEGPLAIGDSLPLAAYSGDGIKARLTLERDEYSYFARPAIDLLASDGQPQRQTGKKCHMATRDPFTRPPAGSLNDRPELPFPPWERFGYWQGGKAEDRWLCLAGFEEEVYGDTSQMRWVPWARPGELTAIDWDEVYDWEMTEDETELRIIGAKEAAKHVRGPRPITYDDDLQRLVLAHRLIAALQQRPR